MKTQEFAYKEPQTVKMATLYELRLMLTKQCKGTVHHRRAC